MRRFACCVLVALAALSACKREPTFDERYASAQKAVRQKAGELDQDMAKRAAEAQAIAPQASGSASDNAI
jgi:hypothetical protein